MEWKKTLTLLCVAVVLTLGAYACDKASPTSSDSPPPPPPQAEAPAPPPAPAPTNPTPPSAPEPHGFPITDDGKNAYSSVTNDLGKPYNYALACFKGDMRDLDKQERVGNPSVVRLEPGQSHNFEAPLACGRQNQCDNLFNIGSSVPVKPPHANLTLNSKIIQGDDCPDECTAPPRPQCEFGPAIYTARTCTWTCPPCVMPEPPKCKFGPAEPDGCGWKCPPCTPCDTSTKVSLTDQLVKDGQSDAYRIATSFVMGPPGKYRLVVSQGPSVLRDVTSDIQQAYLSPGNAETPLPCGSAPVDILFEVVDDRCDGDVVCETFKDNVSIPECECVKPKPPQCEFGDATWNADACKWECPPCVPCVDSSESLVCVFNETTNKVACKAHASHQGRIVMKQSGSPILTEDFTGDKAFFSPVLPCDDNPVNVMLINADTICGPRERCGVETTTVIPTKDCPPGYHLHPEDCTCYCDPVGKPLCQEQVWDEINCQWRGDCDICHVSNGGQPGECDWNLQEQNKKYTPGHGLHMDPANQCPPDYFGQCDGRYLTNPHPCQLACQSN